MALLSFYLVVCLLDANLLSSFINNIMNITNLYHLSFGNLDDMNNGRKNIQSILKIV